MNFRKKPENRGLQLYIYMRKLKSNRELIEVASAQPYDKSTFKTGNKSPGIKKYGSMRRNKEWMKT